MLIYLIYALICLYLRWLGWVTVNLDVKTEHPDKDMKAAIWIINVMIKATVLHMMPYMVVRNMIKRI